MRTNVRNLMVVLGTIIATFLGCAQKTQSGTGESTPVVISTGTNTGAGCYYLGQYLNSGVPCDDFNVGACHGGQVICTGTTGFCQGAVKPTPEVCNGLDDDCDGTADEGLTCGTGIPACDPTAIEVCGNHSDDNCNGEVDENCACASNATRDCTILNSGLKGLCAYGTETCENGMWSQCVPTTKPKAEVCGNHLDDDCDGTPDNGCPVSCKPGDTLTCPTGMPGACGYGHSTCQQDGTWSPCGADTKPTAEICSSIGVGNGIDDNCNGEVDETCPCVVGDIQDCDTGKYGVCSRGVMACLLLTGKTVWGQCTPKVSAQAEICGNGIDEDCSGMPDNGCSCDPSGVPLTCNTQQLGPCATGVMRCLSDGTGYSGICEVTFQRTSAETCGDAVDNDCNGETDDGCECIPYSYAATCTTGMPGLCALGAMYCNGTGTGLTGVCEPDWFFFGNTEECGSDDTGNGYDENCDGQVDEGCTCDIGSTRTCTTDEKGACHSGTMTCLAKGVGSEWGPCNRKTGPISEVCSNGLDDDCDGLQNNGCPTVCTPSALVACNAQAQGACRVGSAQCNLTGNGLLDCISTVSPKAEACDSSTGKPNGVDENCDGRTDETCACTPNASVGTCHTGMNGVCGFGVLKCASDGSGVLQTCQLVVTSAQAEQCGQNGTGNGFDDDCDGAVDNGCTCTLGATQACTISNTFGVCTVGSQACVSKGAGTAWGPCVQTIARDVEQCNNLLDDDCDGRIDNHCTCTALTQIACVSGSTGACLQGTRTCLNDQDGWGPCVPSSFGSAELCNHLDDNCNGIVDEGCGCPYGPSSACSTGMLGACAKGTMQCLPSGDGYSTCIPDTFGVIEVANGLDDNCNGQIDEGLP